MRSRWPILTLLCVLSSLFVPGIASASAVAGAETRVWAFVLAEQVYAIHGACHLLFNNAGVGAPSVEVWETTVNDWKWVHGVNVMGVVHAIQSFVPRMIAGGEQGAMGARSIVFISSANAELVAPDRGEYCLSKCGVSMMAKLFAVRLGPHGIPVYEIRPGVIRTEIHESSGDPGRVERIGATAALGRAGEAEEVARVIVWLASDEASYMSGALVDVSGGR